MSAVRSLGRWLVALLATAGAAALIVAAAFYLEGPSARTAPGPLETRVARAARHLAIPGDARAAENPVPRTAAAVAAGRAHFADHCAVCHGNDGKGDTTYGRRMSPRAPDMTLPATQELGDGELFWIIEHGVRLTGMPGFGDDDPTNDGESWELVHFIRRLPEISAEELAAMERLNPTLSPADVENEREIEAFLAGEDEAGDEHHH